jgi:hypothetical protein
MALASAIISSIILLFVKEPGRGTYLKPEEKVLLD